MCSGVSISTRISSARGIRNETRFQHAIEANSLQFDCQCILRCHCTMSFCPGKKRKSNMIITFDIISKYPVEYLLRHF